MVYIMNLPSPKGQAILVKWKELLKELIRGLSVKYEDTGITEVKMPIRRNCSYLYGILKNHLAIHIWIFIPKSKFWNKIIKHFNAVGCLAQSTASISVTFSDIITLFFNVFLI